MATKHHHFDRRYCTSSTGCFSIAILVFGGVVVWFPKISNHTFKGCSGFDGSVCGGPIKTPTRISQEVRIKGWFLWVISPQGIPQLTFDPNFLSGTSKYLEDHPS